MNHRLSILLILSIFFISCTKETPKYQRVKYSDNNNWMKVTSTPTHQVDLFYLYPTSWSANSSDQMYSQIDDPTMRESSMAYYDSQGSLFEGFANIYAPYYRQYDESNLSELSTREQNKAIKEVTYKDVEDAFTYYIRNYNKGRPFILAGHSQGSCMIKYLLENYLKQNPNVYARMVVAYAPGFSFEKSFFDENPHLKIASSDTSIRAVATWNSERKNQGSFGTSNTACREGAISINPISWKHNYSLVPADTITNLGHKTSRERYSAQVQLDSLRNYEVLIVGVDDNRYDSPQIGDCSLHNEDYGLYYYNIRENAQKRVYYYFHPTTPETETEQ